jgi:hypothetical protein
MWRQQECPCSQSILRRLDPVSRHPAIGQAIDAKVITTSNKHMLDEDASGEGRIDRL